jgi:hypothetical protein
MFASSKRGSAEWCSVQLIRYSLVSSTDCSGPEVQLPNPGDVLGGGAGGDRPDVAHRQWGGGIRS